MPSSPLPLEVHGLQISDSRRRTADEFLLHSTPGFIYPIAFALVVGGLVLYHCGGAEHGAQHLAAHREPLVGRRPQSDGCNGSEPLCTPCSGDAPAGDTPWVGGALAVNVSRR